MSAPGRAKAPLRIGRPWVTGFLRSPSGIGAAGRLTWTALSDRGLAPAAVDLSARFQPEDMISPLPAEPPRQTDEGPILFHANPPEFWVALTKIRRRHLAGRMRIGAWVWELQELPRAWRSAANLVDEIWVPSRYCAEVFTGLGRPVRVVPHPAAAGFFAAPRDRTAFGLPEEKVIFLAVCDLRSSLARKNPLGAIQAYASAFDQTSADRPVLVLKVGGYAGHEHLLDKIGVAAGRAGVRLVTDALSQEGMDALIAASDAFVSLHRAEGFGLVVAQAMLAGKPTIVTDWSGTRDFTDDTTACLVPAKEVPVADPQGIYPPTGIWAEPDMETAIAWMRRLTNEPSLRQEMGARATMKARSILSVDAWWRNVGADFRNACGVADE